MVSDNYDSPYRNKSSDIGNVSQSEKSNVSFM